MEYYCYLSLKDSKKEGEREVMETWTVTWLRKAEIMGRFAAAHSCALQLLIHGRRAGENRMVWIIPWLTGTRPDFQRGAADKTYSFLLCRLWVCGEWEDEEAGAPQPSWSQDAPCQVSWGLDFPCIPAWILSCSSLQAGTTSPHTPRSRQEAVGKSKGQEKGMAEIEFLRALWHRM